MDDFGLMFFALENPAYKYMGSIAGYSPGLDRIVKTVISDGLSTDAAVKVFSDIVALDHAPGTPVADVMHFTKDSIDIFEVKKKIRAPVANLPALPAHGYNVTLIPPSRSEATDAIWNAFMATIKITHPLSGTRPSWEADVRCIACHGEGHPVGLCPIVNAPSWMGPNYNQIQTELGNRVAKMRNTQFPARGGFHSRRGRN